MNICVCIKQVPDTSVIKIDPVTHTLVRKGVPAIINPFDTYAVEIGARLKESTDGRLVVICMGPPQAKDALRVCLSVGADEAYLVSDRVFGGSDTLATGYILSEAIKEIEKREELKFDLVICGKQAVDGDTAQVGPQIAEQLDLPQITYATKVEPKDGGLLVTRETETGHDVIKSTAPAVITVVKPGYEPRYATYKTWAESKEKTVHVLTSAELESCDLNLCGLNGSPTKVTKTYTPVVEKHGVKVDGASAEEISDKLIDLLVAGKLL